MRTAGSHRSGVLALAAALILTAACGDRPPTVPVDAARPMLDADASGFSVTTVHLRPAEGSASSAWGTLVVFVGTFVPPNPCTDPDAESPACVAAPPNPCLTELTGSGVLVCGVIHNPGGEAFTGGTVAVTTVREGDPVLLEFFLPPSPCATYLLRGGTAGATGTGLPAVQASFDSPLGALVAVATTPGPPNDPGSTVSGTPGPPNEPVCVVGTEAR